MTRHRLQYIVLILLLIICGGFLGILALKYVLPVILPFLIGWIIAMLVNSPSKRICAGTHIPLRVVRLLLSTFFVIITFSLLTVGIWQGTGALWRLLVEMGEDGVYDGILSFINAPFSSLGVAPELAARLEETLSSMLSTALSRVAEAITGWVTLLPGALFFLLVTVISLIYIALDLERINAFVKKLLPEKALLHAISIRKSFVTVFKKYVRSYLALMLITFAFIFAGLLILGVKHALIIAVLISLLDVLPIIGVGTVIIPWSVFELFGGNLGLGIGLAVLFILHTVMRELIEPKIVGASLNMHPIITLILLYGSYSLFGFFGLISVPAAAFAISVVFDGRADRLNR